MKPLYTAIATVTGGREGHGRTDDGKLDMDLSLPKELGGPGGAGTNPEQLFAVGYSACFLGAVRLVASQRKVSADGASVTGHVMIVSSDDGGWELAVELHCKLPGVPREEADAIVREAHNNVCPYSKATRGNIDVKLILED